jgi:glycosyltransferase involved in cell wall biosynthesis
LAKAPTVEFLDEALERAWQNRSRLREMGDLAAMNVRQFVSNDPGRDFVRELIAYGRSKDKMSAPTVTVLLTAHNYGRFVDDAIESVLAQDFPLDQTEIIVIDDGSTDDTQDRVRKYGSRVRYFYKSNGGQASALNFGIARASGQVVTLLDADDLFLPQKLVRVVEAFKADPNLGMVYHRFEEWHMRTGARRDWHFVEVSGDLQREPQKFTAYVAQPTSVLSFRRSALEELLPIPEKIRMLADCYLASLVPFLVPVLAIPEVLATYRIHGENSHYKRGLQISLETQKKKLLMWQTVIGAMRKWIGDHGYTRQVTPVNALLDHWTRQLQELEFAASRPRRVRFLLLLLRKNYRSSSLQTWRFTLLNYLTALCVLFVDYQTAAGFYDWCSEAQEKGQRWFRKLFFFRTVSKQDRARV